MELTMTPLRLRMTEDMQVRNLAPKTQHSYLAEISRFARHFGKSPDLLGPDEIRAYCLYLIHDKQLSAGSIKVALGAIRFLYKVTLRRGWDLDEDIPGYRGPKKLPVVLSQQEVRQFLDAVRNLKHRVILTTCYATGLRVSEATHLTLTAIDSQRMVIRVEQGKGRKDRYVMLSPRLLELLRDYWRQTHPKLWLFPGTQPGQPTSHLTVEWACRVARERSGLTKPVTPHSLRHAFAVHLLEAGADLRTIQLLLDHSSLRTTALYLQIATNKVCATISPLDALSCLPAVPTDAAPA
jgi:integrase/recombinase XerD